MSALKVFKAHMIMEFYHLARISQDNSEQCDKALNLNQQLGEFEDSIDADEFVARSLSAMAELAKADPAIQEFMGQYSHPDKRKALVDSVENKVSADTGKRLDLEEQMEDAVGDYWRARDKFTKAGGRCLDNMISRFVLEDFAGNVGRKARDAFVGTYEQVLSENGPFENKIKELGLDDSATVVRYANMYPQVAMTPDVERDVVKIFSELLQEGMDQDFGDVATPDDYQALVGGNVRATNIAMEFYRCLPLADVYIDLREMSKQEAVERIEEYRQDRHPNNDNELAR